ncbi:sensor domain-containing diguanylate cyclase [Persephonella sp.]
MGEVFIAESRIRERLEELEKQISQLAKRLEESQLTSHNYRLMVENAGEAIVILQDRKVKYLNPKAASLVGIRRDLLENVSFESFIHPEDREFVLRNYERRINGLDAPESYSFRIIDIRNRVKWVHIRPVRITYEGRPALLEFLIDVTRQKELEQELEKTNSMLKSAIESLSEAVLIVDREFEPIIYNSNFLKIWNLTGVNRLTASQIIEKALSFVKNPTLFKERIEKIRNSPAGEFSGKLELSDGRVYEWYTKPYRINNQTAGRIWNLKDITDKVQTELALREREKKYRELVENINSIVLRWKPDGTITYINRYGSRFFGYRRKELIGKSVFETIVPERDSDGKNLHRLIEAITKTPDRFQNNENENITKDGRRVWILWKNKGVYDRNNNLIEILSIGNDITEKRKMEKRLEKLATTDSLTGLINRMRFEEILEQAVRDSSEGTGKIFSLFLFDIDDFKKINDTYGHNIGDRVLVDLSRLVGQLLDDSDIFSRWGGEEFFILLPDTGLEEAARKAESIREAVALSRFPFVGKITISGGVTQFREYDDPVSIVIRADKLLYSAKNSGKNKICWE